MNLYTGTSLQHREGTWESENSIALYTFVTMAANTALESHFLYCEHIKNNTFETNVLGELFRHLDKSFAEIKGYFIRT